MNFKISTKSVQRSLNQATKSAQKSLERLSTGIRLNRAADDAAGLAVALSQLAEAGALKVGRRNANDGISAVAIADGATQQLDGITTRMRELATQAGNETLSQGNRDAIQSEFTQLQEEADRIVQTTEFNGQKLLSGDGFSVQVGATGGPEDSIEIDNANVEGVLAAEGFSSFSISDVSSARQAIDGLAAVGKSVSQVRGNLGAFSTRLDKAISNNESRELGLVESASRIRDADVAFEVANLTNSNIRQNAATATFAQITNINASMVERLLG